MSNRFRRCAPRRMGRTGRPVPASRLVMVGAGCTGQPSLPTRPPRQAVQHCTVHATIDVAARLLRPGSRIALAIDGLRLAGGALRRPVLVLPNGLARRADLPPRPDSKMDGAAPPDPVPSSAGEAGRHAAGRTADRWPAP